MAQRKGLDKVLPIRIMVVFRKLLLIRIGPLAICLKSSIVAPIPIPEKQVFPGAR